MCHPFASKNERDAQARSSVEPTAASHPGSRTRKVFHGCVVTSPRCGWLEELYFTVKHRVH
jgi:hypothetical protein